mmetsp:Transcript_19035/g.44343  ORF Transcript_19035/g.44343 Transcript_19035/m.44343 type:complete len:128 (-) Transcript_19035:29-412(-)
MDVLFCLCLAMQDAPQTILGYSSKTRRLVMVIGLCALPVSLVLFVVDTYIWLQTHTGNANFVFFQCLLYQIVVTLFFMEYTSAAVCHEKAMQYLRKQRQEQTVAVPNNNSNEKKDSEDDSKRTTIIG